MTEKQAVIFLRCPFGALIDFALQDVNLTWKEQKAIDLCARQGYTQEKAAELLGYSPDAVQKWYRAAMGKIIKSFDGKRWILSIVMHPE